MLRVIGEVLVAPYQKDVPGSRTEWRAYHLSELTISQKDFSKMKVACPLERIYQQGEESWEAVLKSSGAPKPPGYGSRVRELQGMLSHN